MVDKAYAHLSAVFRFSDLPVKDGRRRMTNTVEILSLRFRLLQNDRAAHKGYTLNMRAAYKPPPKSPPQRGWTTKQAKAYLNAFEKAETSYAFSKKRKFRSKQAKATPYRSEKAEASDTRLAGNLG